MTVTATFLHSRPQHEIASTIRNRLAGCRSAGIVSGFATPDGVDALRAKSVSSKIKRLVLGAATFKAFEALDGLISSGLPAGAARVHLGHTRATKGRKHPFARYRPMLHSKIYLLHTDRPISLWRPSMLAGKNHFACSLLGITMIVPKASIGDPGRFFDVWRTVLTSAVEATLSWRGISTTTRVGTSQMGRTI
jgi:hypothetical protein